MGFLFYLQFLKSSILAFRRRKDSMAEEDKTYVCDLCGQEVKVLKSGAGTLVCCDQPMNIKED